MSKVSQNPVSHTQAAVTSALAANCQVLLPDVVLLQAAAMLVGSAATRTEWMVGAQRAVVLLPS